MQKLFDNILIERFREVFNNHQETYRPNDWNKLQAKMNNSRKGKVIVLSQIAKAASIVLFLGVAVFVSNEFTKNNLAENKANPLINRSIDIESNKVVPTIENKTKQDIGEKNTPIQKYDLLENPDDNKTDSSNIEEIIQNRTVNGSKNELATVENDRYSNIKDELEKYHNDILSMDTMQNQYKKPLNLNNKPELIIVENTVKPGKRIGIGLELASVSNYSIDADNNGTNIGGGITAAFRISKNVNFSTGAFIAKQSVSYSGSRNSSLQSDYNYAVPKENGLEMINTATNESELSFLAIDIPLNIQFKISKFSISTGLSSLLYVQEKIKHSYTSNVTNTQYNSVTRSYDTFSSVENVSHEENSESFDRFDFARLLNFSVGYDIPLAKGNLVVEPYIKYPLGSLSSKEIKMGSGGFALKYIF